MAKAAALQGRDFTDISTPKKKKTANLIIGLSITLVLVGVLVWIFGFNAFGWRDDHIFPFLADVPVVGQWIPADTGQASPAANVSELQQEIASLETQVATLTVQRDQLEELRLSQASEIVSQGEALANFESERDQFLADRYEFDRQLAGEAPRDFINFFANMNPETAAIIFEEHVQEQAITEEIQVFLTMFHEMSTRNAADTLEDMMPGQTQFVVEILEALPTATAGTIINAMDVSNRATIVTLRNPFNE